MWTKGLNSEQSKAVLHNQGPMLILAGAGSGKTTVLVARTGRLIAEGVAAPDETLVLTFTNKAARELRERVAKKLGPLAKGLWAGTFHSFGLSLLRRHAETLRLPQHFGLLDPTDQTGVLREILQTIRIPAKADFDLDRLSSRMSQWREGHKTQSDSEDPYDEMTEILLPKYQAAKRRLGVVDFDDLILIPTQMIEEHPKVGAEIRSRINQLMVDEFQDTNLAQMKLVTAILDSHQNVTVVGDDDQSIYGWRGAQIRNILDFPKKFKPCQVIRLEQNYRSTPAILNLANAVIAKNEERHGKILRPQTKESGPLPELFVYPTEEVEADEVAQHIFHLQRQGYKNHEMAVLYRSNQQSELIEASLRRNRLAYRISGGTGLFDKKEVRDALAYLRAAVAPNEVVLRRILNVPSRGVGDSSVECLTEFARQKHLSFWQALNSWRESSVNPKSGSGIDQFLKALERFPQVLLAEGDIAKAWSDFFREIAYLDHLRSLYKPDVAAKRWETVTNVGRIVADHISSRPRKIETLRQFLDAMELRDSVEDEDQHGKVHLLTLHASKGLEWPVVILVGLEEDILPHKRLGQDVAEERRLLYVGMTRAQKHLIMSRAGQRRRHGRQVVSAPSRFLLELTKGYWTEYADGVRPLAVAARRSMLDELYKKLDNQSQIAKEES